MTRNFYDIKKIKSLAQGNWLSILAVVTPSLHDAIKKTGRHVSCPVHGGKDGFRLFKDANETGGGICNSCGTYADGLELIQWINGSTFSDALNQVAEFLNIAPENSTSDKGSIKNKPVLVKTEANNKKLVPSWVKQKEESLKFSYKNVNASDDIMTLWNKSIPLSCATENGLSYLRNRKVLSAALTAESTDSIRFNPSLPYYDEVEEDGKTKFKKIAEYPALICAIRDKEGEIVTLHRTYLSRSGGKKAKVSHPRKMMGVPTDKSINGGAIRLGFPTDGILGVAEGLETALSAYHASNIPTWSTINAGLMGQFKAPENIHTVLIWADKDKSLTGEIAASTLAARLRSEGKRVYILMPNDLIPKGSKGIDWNDVLINRGLDGFPRAAYLKEFLFREVKKCA